MRKIILIAGPSGAGKTTISHYLQEKYQIPRVITHTTRPMRTDEDQQSYYFETDRSFARLHFFEHVKYGAYQYGSSHEALNSAWQKNNIVSLIVDIAGVRSYLAALGKRVYFLYVTTSSPDILRERLIHRGDKPETIKKRLSGKELNALPTDLRPQAHIIVNDHWQKTKNQLDILINGLQKQ